MRMLKKHGVIISVVCIVIIAISLVLPRNTSERFIDPAANDENLQIADSLGTFIQKYNITSVCEISCGNSAWVPLILKKYPSLKYTGYDKNTALVNEAKVVLASSPNASVMLADPLTVTPQACDLIICRNLLQTLSYEDIKKVTIKFAGYDCKFFALGSFTHGSSHNQDITTGSKFPINLELHPFNMSPADVSSIKNTNTQFFMYTASQMRGFIQGNAFWTSNLK
jgi:hypothetical protein